ncbi:MAG TPA: 50S ribosomal protein L11 methyltransferase [Nitrospiraceae bacterium]|nr:50S ribosomal protein L11 methyltransferase [Nitrospiraceae bacterium]
MGQEWVELSVRTSADPAEVLSLLNDPAASGAWQEEGILHLYWPAPAWKADRLTDLQSVLAGLGHPVSDRDMTVGGLADRDWNEARAHAVQPVRIGRVVIRPSWHPVDLAAREVELIIDPKQAFGTGHHATTQLLIEWLQEVVLGGESVLDLGTGSGILAMTALRLGARCATGIDHDAVAIDCAREYAKQNGFGPELRLEVASAGAPHEQAEAPVDLLVANLDRQTILDCREALASHAQRGARLLLSGLLSEHVAEVTQALAANALYIYTSRERGGWVALEASAGLSCDDTPDTPRAVPIGSDRIERL